MIIKAACADNIRGGGFMKKEAKNAHISREAFYRFREEIAAELGIFYGSETPPAGGDGMKIPRRMAEREKKHGRKRK